MSNRSDNFNRADSSSTMNPPSDSGGNYTGAVGTGGITSNKGYFPTSPTSTPAAGRFLDCGAADADLQAKVYLNGAGNWNYLIFYGRVSDDNNNLELWIDNTGNWSLFKLSSGSLTLSGSNASAGVPSDGDVIKLSVSGNTWNAYLNGSLVLGPITESFNSSATKFGIGTYGNVLLAFDDLSITPAVSSSIAFTDAAGTTITALPTNHGAGTVVIKAVATGFTFANPTSWSVSGVSGWSVSSSAFVDGTHYTVTLGCPSAATPPAGTTGTLTVTDTTDSVNNTLTISTPTLSSSPTHAAAGSAPTLTMTGTTTLWANETASGLFTVTGGTSPSFATPTGITNTGASDVLTVGTSAGTLTLKDTSTGATFSFTADAPAALAAGTPIQVCTSAAVTIYLDGTNGSTAPTGGIAPYSYQWYGSTTSNFTPGGGNIIGGATSQNLTVGSPSTTLKFYKCIVTDSQGSPATATTVEAPGRLLDVNLKVGFLGDSLYYNTPTSGNPPPTNWASYAVYLGGRIHAVTSFNGGAPGSGVNYWLPSTDPNWLAWPGPPPDITGYAGLLEWFEGNIAGLTTVVVRIGANDSALSAANYGTRLGTIVNHLLANVSGLQRVILNYPTYGRPAGSYGGAANAKFQAFQAQIDALVNGTTILAGDKKQWDASAILTGWRQDDIHPSAEGSRELALADILGVAAVLYPAATGGINRAALPSGVSALG